MGAEALTWTQFVSVMGMLTLVAGVASYFFKQWQESVFARLYLRLDAIDGRLQVDDAARAFYATQRARGHGHARALRGLTDRWLRILMAMVETRTLYAPEPHRRRLPTAELSS